MPRLAPLPVDDVVPTLRAALAEHGAAVLHAPPGAGKTTRVPPALLDDVAGRVLVLEPRRIAARTAARRIAEERGFTPGREVGWQIRFERRFTRQTRLLFLTEGILVQWLQRDPFLDGVDALIFDEVHERSLFTDLSLAMATRIRREVRPDLQLVAMSATLEAGPLAELLAAPTVASEGRLHPVRIEHLDLRDEPRLERRVELGVRRALAQGEGDLLVFLPGVGEIRRCQSQLEELAGRLDLDLRPLYGALSPEEQEAALRAASRRRVVLATNVAETSVTVEGVGTVIDTGLARQLRFDPSSGLDRLDVVPIAVAAADQRAGRAGRQGPGLCLRLWPQDEHRHRAPFEVPEIRRVDLSWLVLQLHAFGETDLESLPWLEAPDPVRLERARRELRDLGAIADRGLTEIGRRLAALPLPPRLGRLVLAGAEEGVAEEAALLAALLEERRPRRDDGARVARSDLLVELDRLGGRLPARLRRARDQILTVVERSLEQPERSRDVAAPADEHDRERSLLRAVAAAWSDRLCRRRAAGSDRALMVGGRGVRLAPGSAVREDELFVAVEVDAGRGGERSEARVWTASAVEREWLPEEPLATVDELVWDDERERVVAERVTRFEDLVLDRRELPIGDDERAGPLLLEAARRDPARALGLDRPDGSDVRRLLARLDFLARHAPELELPSADRLIAELLPLLAAGRSSFAELRSALSADALLGLLDWTQRQALDEQAPDRLQVPSGSRIRIDYETGGPPVLAVRIQELFGLAETPRLARGRVPVLLHLLAPNGRPQQVTDDLASFWQNTYPVVRKELAGRYPKHAWPEDPLAAAPEHRPRRRR